MSVRSDVAPCRYCGAVQLLATMVQIQENEYVYACNDCAVAEKVRR